MRLHQRFAATAALLAGACASAPATPPSPAPESVPPTMEAVPPAVAREFRAVWVATVGNIDWPSRPGLPADSQQAELLAIMDRAAELRLNAVIFQVRTAADALYASELEPWSEYLSGTQGVAPTPAWDPLAFAVEAAHARGLELHAWFNPYRARHPSAQSPAAATHVSQARPELVVRYGTHLWLDPGLPEVVEHSIRVITDVARRYDVDGIHIDDYFYPYRELDAQRREIPFPDEASFARYQAAGGRLARDDWRRRNVDEFVARLHREVHAVKPYLKFGVSPIGIWRPGQPAEACCFDAYEQIYADARKWFAEGTLDYFVPQLYRTLSDTLMNYGVMLGWWGEQNATGRHLYVGMIPNSVRRPTTGTPTAAGTSARGGWPVEEIISQIYVARGHPAAQGHVHFSARSLMHNDSLTAALRRTVYRSPALVPTSPWLPSEPPAPPRAVLSTGAAPGTLTLELTPGDATVLRTWILQVRRGERWSTQLVPAGERRLSIADATTVRNIVVKAVSRMGIESQPVLLARGVPVTN